MPKPKTVVLLTREMQAKVFSEHHLARLTELVDLVPAQRDQISAEWQQSAMKDAEIIITGWGTEPISDAMLDAAPGLRLMCHSAGSIKHLVSDTFAARGIGVTSAAPALAVGVAEFAFGLMLMSMKAVWACVAATNQGKWDRESVMDWICEPHDATVGIIAASTVGRELIRLCKTLSLKATLLHDPFVSDEEAARLGVELVTLDELMRRADVVHLCAPNVPATHHMINAEMLALLRDKAIFINTSRGALVDEAALIAELEKGRIFACLDVTDPEPPEPGSPLYTLPNCILTPHIAGAVKQNIRRQGDSVVEQIEAFVAGQPLPCKVPLEKLDILA
jgi:phosphoglycerate dehydrogenase-like enzyme